MTSSSVSSLSSLELPHQMYVRALHKLQSPSKADLVLHRLSSTSPQTDGTSLTPLPNTSQLKRKLLHMAETIHRRQRHTPVPELLMVDLPLNLLPLFLSHQALPLQDEAVSQHWVHWQVLPKVKATLDMDMPMMTKTMTMMRTTSLVRSLEICLPAVRSQGWRFRILQIEMIPERW